MAQLADRGGPLHGYGHLEPFVPGRRRNLRFERNVRMADLGGRLPERRRAQTDPMRPLRQEMQPFGRRAWAPESAATENKNPFSAGRGCNRAGPNRVYLKRSSTLNSVSKPINANIPAAIEWTSFNGILVANRLPTRTAGTSANSMPVVVPATTISGAP